jgi:rhodanese-related sulfurtransferase
MSEDMRVKAEDIDSVMADARIFFLDVREPKEIEELGSYQGYVNIPLSQLESRLGELPRDRPILTA